MQGVAGDVAVTSSSRAFGDPLVRGSKAFDGDPGTGWVPGRSIDGEWLEATFPEERTVSRVLIDQPAEAAAWVSTVDVIVDGRRAATADLTRGRVEVVLPPTRATTVRLAITGHEGEGFPTIGEVDLDGARVTSDPAAAERCVTIGTVDGDPVRVKVVGGGEGDGQRLVAGCALLRLGPGEHALRSRPGWTTDSMVLRDSIGETAVAGESGPSLTVDRRSPSSYRIDAPPAQAPYLLVVGQNVHPGWRATMDGEPMGPPLVVDGYAMGWWVDDLDGHVFEVEYAPQDVSDIALATSGAAVLLASALVVLPRRVTGPVTPLEPSAPRTHPAEGRDRRRVPPGARWLVLALGCGVVAGLPGLVIGAAVGVWHLGAAPSPRTLLRLSGVAMALAPVAWIVGNLSRWGEIGPQLVLGNPAPSHLVVAALILLVVGSWRDVR